MNNLRSVNADINELDYLISNLDDYYEILKIIDKNKKINTPISYVLENG